MSSKLQMQYRVVNRCRGYTAQAPNITPFISGLSTYSSFVNEYTIVYVTGDNFSLQGSTGVSTITFGNIKNIPVTYLSPYNIAFVVPTSLVSGTYSIKVVNNNYPTSLYSNSVNYSLL
jgi:uncharacterized protein (TIGR03437 family)